MQHSTAVQADSTLHANSSAARRHWVKRLITVDNKPPEEEVWACNLPCHFLQAHHAPAAYCASLNHLQDLLHKCSGSCKSCTAEHAAFNHHHPPAAYLGSPITTTPTTCTGILRVPDSQYMQQQVQSCLTTPLQVHAMPPNHQPKGVASAERVQNGTVAGVVPRYIKPDVLKALNSSCCSELE
jgi:hypothetical protein